VDLLPYLTGKMSGAPHEALYWRFGQQIAIRMGDWKLVKGVGSKGVGGIELRGKADTADAELYNLAQDIGEKQNLADKEPAKLKELAAAWEKWNSGLVEPRWFPGRAGAARPRLPRQPQAGGRGEVLDTRFRQLDLNGDGKVSAAEFPRDRLFRQMDRNGDGYVTLEEARAFYAAGRRQSRTAPGKPGQRG